VLGRRALREEWAETIVALAEMHAKSVELVMWLGLYAVEKGQWWASFLVKEYWERSDARASEEARAMVIEALGVSLRDPDKYARRLAVEALLKIGNARAVEPLIAALRDPDAAVRAFAALALEEIGDARAVEPLIAALRDPDIDVRIFAAWALGKIGAPAVEPLIAALRAPDKYMRRGAARALGKIGAPAVEPLIAALRDPNADVRWEAAYALGKIDDARALPELERLAREDPSPHLADAAREAIARIRERMEKTD